jgi:photosystem II stability/assembly factor-like uncharacterized protein
MKKLFIINIIFLCTSITHFAQQTGWISQASATTEKLNSIVFVNDSTGWAVGRLGKILKTNNGGETWITQISNTLNELKSVMFYDQLIGWCSGDMGKVYKTFDGGATWTQYSAGTSSRLNSIYFSNVSDGWACGENGIIVHSSDGGQSWSSVNSGQWAALTSIKFTNGVGRVTMMGGVILVTIDGGSTWNVENLNTASTVNSVWFNSVSDGIAVGNEGIKSLNNGTSWTTVHAFNNKNIMSIFMIDPDTGWCAGQFGSIYNTVDGGENWIQQVSGTTQDINSISFVNSNLGWVCGNNGTILKTTNGGITSIDKNDNNVLSEFNLEQNYPNPFNPSTSIEYRVGSSEYVTLKVYDILGNEIATLVNEYKPAGEYEIEFNTSSIKHHTSSGVYFYQLKAMAYLETKKMLLIK